MEFFQLWLVYDNVLSGECNLSLEEDLDQPLSTKEMIKKLINILGKDNCSIEKILKKKILVYTHGVKKECNWKKIRLIHYK